MRKNVIDAFEAIWEAADATTDELDHVEKLAARIMTDEEFIYWTDGYDKNGEAVINGIKLEDEKPERLAPLHDPECDCSQCREEDRLGYDADFGDPRQYCRHGTFIGSWWGPDYLCYRCEAGED